MEQIYKVFVNNRCFRLMRDAGREANIPGTLVVNYDSAETLSLLLDLAHSTQNFFNKVIVLHADPSRVLSKIEHLTDVVDAAGGVVKNSEGLILMIFRNGKWDLPKGKLEKGESLEQCALREVEEECHVKGLVPVRPLGNTFHTYKTDGKIHLKRTFWYEMKTDSKESLIPQKEEGITEVKWMSETEVDSVLQNSFLSLVEVINLLNT